MGVHLANETDYLLAGGGLQNCLIALMLLHRNPETRVTLVEQGQSLGRNQTWSFHAADVPPACCEALAPAIQYRWPAYYVVFPGVRRRVRCAYRTLTSTHLHDLLEARIAEAPHARLRLNETISAVESDRIVLASGETIRGRHVIDGRGQCSQLPAAETGYQKFVGLELALDSPSSLEVPILMDARVAQLEGFRFFYVLPFAPGRVLVEDTRFSNTPDLDVVAMRQEVLRYAREIGLRVRDVVRSESGVLPMPWTMRPNWSTVPPLAGGYRGGFYHPATGYSVPVALRVAQHIADRAPDSPFDAGWSALVRHHHHQFRFATFLNRLLFTAYTPDKRHHIFERFYRLPEPAIERFYRLDLTAGDKARLFLGRPPRGFSWQHVLKGAPQS